jgi:hypothetical protein
MFKLSIRDRQQCWCHRVKHNKCPPVNLQHVLITNG